MATCWCWCGGAATPSTRSSRRSRTPTFPQDDLALAVALKSPLFGLTDDDLFKLAWQRKGTLRQALDHHAATDGKFGAARARLEACERRVVTETPFAFYAWLLGGDG